MDRTKSQGKAWKLKTRECDKLKVIIDSREPVWVKKWLPANFKDVTFEIKKLDEGDFSSDTVLVERKQISDLDSSHNSSRLRTQLSRLTAHRGDKIVILLITGSIEEYAIARKKRGTTINKETLHKVVASLLVRDNIRVIWNYHQENALREMIYIMQAVEEGKLDIPSERNCDMLIARFLNLTPNQWYAVKEAFGPSICHMCDLSKKEWMEVRGLPSKKIDAIMKLLKYGWE